MTAPADLLPKLQVLHQRIRDAVVRDCEAGGVEELAEIERDDRGDTIYAIDRVGEEVLVDYVAREIAPETSVVLIAEGLDDGPVVLPEGLDESQAELRIIVDPIDGTRGLMYQKRPAWVLTGVAPNRGPETDLRDIEAAIMSEIPLVKQNLCDVLWAVRGQGARAERENRATGERSALALRPSSALSIAHGFSTISRFFPGARELLARIDEAMVRACIGPVTPGKASCFEDQYIASAGQLYELIMGHDRFIADLRPLVEPVLEARGEPLGICAHPYDLCTELIAREAGVIVRCPDGTPLQAPLDLASDVAWVGYANEAIRAQVEPALHAAMTANGVHTSEV
jgi:fructose-1,6-bisphosphatase/inositol monophosphatase family enzyme